MTVDTLQHTLIPAWHETQNGTAVLSHVPAKAGLSHLEQAFDAARRDRCTHMLIPAEFKGQPAIAALISREDRAWELMGQRTSLNQTEDGDLSYNLRGCEPLVG